MAVPRNRTSNARKNARRSHHARTPKVATSCANCSAPTLPHHVCPSCGQYRGRALVAGAEESKE